MPLLARDGLQLHYPGQRRRRQQHEQQKSSRTRTFIVFIVIPVLLAAWCIGTVILVVSRDTGQQQQQQPSVDSDSPLIRRREKSDAAASDDCEIYGCPIYPPEIDDVIVNETLLEDSKMQLVHDHDPSALAAAADATSSSRRRAFHSFATTTHATITRQSNQHEFNQDKSVIFTPFLTLQTPRGTKSFLVAIFDGHGVLGHLLADHVRHQVPTVLANKLNARPCCQSSAWIAQQLNVTFLEVNQHVTPSAYALRGGCTASVSLRIGNRLFVANAGDSRTILVKYSYYNSKKDDDNSQMMQEGGEYAPPIQEPLGNWTMGNTTMENGIVQDIPFQTRKDKAHLPDERARITSLNGTIHIPPHNPNLSRVVVYSAAAQPPESIGLAMSRSLGDWEWKRIGVTAEPIVHVLDLDHYCQHPLDASKAAANADENYCSLLLIAASDGVWDLRRPEFYAKRLRESFFPSIIDNNDHGVPFHRRLLEACVNVFWQVAPAQAQWYRDDMSVIVMEANP